MAFKRKKIVSAVVASLITVTPNLYAGKRNKDITYEKGNRIDILTCIMGGTLAAGIVAAGKMIHDNCKNNYNVFNDYDNESFSDNNQDDDKNREPAIFVSEYYKNTPDQPSQYLINYARGYYINEHPEAVDKVDDYINRFTCCYRAATILYGLDNKLGKDSPQVESILLRNIVDDMLTIPGIERMYIRPQRQLVFYLLRCYFTGTFDDVNRWVDRIVVQYRPQFLNGVPFSIICLNCGYRLFSNVYASNIMKYLKNTKVRIERNGDSWSFVSEECFGSKEFNDCMRLTIGPDNRKTLHYVYNSPSVRRCCECELEY